MPFDPLVAKRAYLARLYQTGKTGRKPDPEVADAVRREIKELILTQHVQDAVSIAPALLPEQKARIAAILLAGN